MYILTDFDIRPNIKFFFNHFFCACEILHFQNALASKAVTFYDIILLNHVTDFLRYTESETSIINQNSACCARWKAFPNIMMIVLHIN